MTATTGYAAFLDRKTHAGADAGIAPTFMPDYLFPFQVELVEWALRKGRAALLEDCGMGKTPQFLVWAHNIAHHTGGNVLILTPLAVSWQTISEAEKFGIDAARSSTGKPAGRITVTNYERLHLFDPSDYAGVVCDESSILKSFDGSRRNAITAFMRKVPYRLLATATAAPNDYTELGTSSEALGYLGHMDMLGRFFTNNRNNAANGQRRMFGEAPEWRLKGHAEVPFWRWVTSWARAVRKPSDLGFDDGPFTLPTLTEREHVIEATAPPEDTLFALPAVDLREQRRERRRTIEDRCEYVRALVDHDQPAVVWCHLNAEADLLERLIPGAVQVSGADSDDDKESKLRGFATGDERVLITKPQIGAWGLNWQHCAHVVAFPSHSYEQYYQAVRRCWRFGQTRPVQVDVVLTEGERKVLDNLRRKAAAADVMFTHLVREMNHAAGIDRRAHGTTTLEVPEWL